MILVELTACVRSDQLKDSGEVVAFSIEPIIA